MIQRSTRPRWNPEPDGAFVVLVKRYVHGEESISPWEPLSVGDEGLVTFATEGQAYSFASEPPGTPGTTDLAVGDLVVVIPLEYVSAIAEGVRWLGVVTPDSVRTAPRPTERLEGGWLGGWGRDAYAMTWAWATNRVQRQRLAMAACECAETVVHHAQNSRELLLRALRSIRAWCAGTLPEDALHSLNTSMVDAWYEADVRRQDLEAASTFGTPPWAAAKVESEVVSAVIDAVKTCSQHETAESSARNSLIYAADAMHTLGTPRATTYATFAPLVERWIPLPVAILSALRYPDAIPFDPSTVPASSAGPRENPRRNQQHRARSRSRR